MPLTLSECLFIANTPKHVAIVTETAIDAHAISYSYNIGYA